MKCTAWCVLFAACQPLCKFYGRLFWARLDGLFGLETFWKSLQPTLGRYEWCMARIFIGRQAPSAKSRFEIIYTWNPPAKYQQSKQQLPFSHGYLWRLFHREVRFFPSHNPGTLQTSACEKAKCWRSALRLATLHSTKEGTEKQVAIFVVGKLVGWQPKKATPPQNHMLFFWLLVIFFLRFSELNFPEYAFWCRICVWRIPRWNRCISWALRPTFSASMRR